MSDTIRNLNFCVTKFLSRLKDFRLRAELSQLELAEHLEVGRATIARLESGEVQPSFTLAFQIARYFSVRIEDVFTFGDENERKERLAAGIKRMLPRRHPSRGRKSPPKRVSLEIY